MSILGKVFGTTAGFFMGGPVGALMGAAAGHYFDRKLVEKQREFFDAATRFQQASLGDALHEMREQARRVAFTLSAVTLGAKMAACDGPVSATERAAFQRIFQVSLSSGQSVAELFERAQHDVEDTEIYAQQISLLFSDSPHVIEDLLLALVSLGEADGPLTSEETFFLQRLSAQFSMPPDGWQRLRAGQSSGYRAGSYGFNDRRTSGSGLADPYAVLGVSSAASDDDIRSAYRKLLRENHPDSVMAQGQSAEKVDEANRKMATINAAWDDICRSRGFKK